MIEQYNYGPLIPRLPAVISLHNKIQINPHTQAKSWIKACVKEDVNLDLINDFIWAIRFLFCYRGSECTFRTYRTNIERIIQWSWFIKKKSILSISSRDVEEFLSFCQAPPDAWVNDKLVDKFYRIDEEAVPNPEWRPFQSEKSGVFLLSDSQTSLLFTSLGSFYRYLLDADIINVNPISSIRQKSKYMRSTGEMRPIRRLSPSSWLSILTYVKEKANSDIRHERTLFIFSLLYGLYLRVSELSASSRWSPVMGDFKMNENNQCWFTTVGKGNKIRKIAVSGSMLKALKRYRKNYLCMGDFPAINEITPLIGHANNPKKPITSPFNISKLVKSIFIEVADSMEKEGNSDHVNVRNATCHWIRHTAISDDVQKRPIEHVRDDAGHSSVVTTDRYINSDLKDRFLSAQKKDI